MARTRHAPQAVAALPPALKRRQLGLLPLVMLIYCSVSGGPFGLEELVGQSGPGASLILLLLTPIVWSLPAAVVVAELSTMMPVEGGYYAWVKKALGPFWGFQEGWWSWLASFVDMAIYPVLFSAYLSTLLESFGITVLKDDPMARWLVGLAVIWPFTILNVRGARPVGGSSILFTVLILAPFVVMVALGLARIATEGVLPWEPLSPPDQPLLDSFGLGLFVVMWNYLGWDYLSTVSEEAKNPVRDVPRMLWIALPLVTLTYFLPVLAGLAGEPDWTRWSEGSLPEIAATLGGPMLGIWVAVTGLVSAAALFNANLLGVSRIPFVMAADGYLPQSLVRIHPRYGTPWISIILCSLIYTVFSFAEFPALVIVDVLLYGAALLMEKVALLVLRARLPHAPRPYRVPGGWPGAVLVSVLPTALSVVAVVATMQSEGAEAVYVAAGALASGFVAYPLFRLLFKRGRPDVFVPLEGDGTRETWRLLTLPRLIPSARPVWR
jgi:amino acid transporter